jgi:hypothetical protein
MATRILDEATIFNVARQMAAPAERRLYVQQACAEDPDLQARIEAMLQLYDQEPSYRHGAIHVRILQHWLTSAAATSGQLDCPALFFGKNWVIRPRISHCIPRRFSVPVAPDAVEMSVMIANAFWRWLPGVTPQVSSERRPVATGSFNQRRRARAEPRTPAKTAGRQPAYRPARWPTGVA